jgi:hypothetical protein
MLRKSIRVPVYLVSVYKLDYFAIPAEAEIQKGLKLLDSSLPVVGRFARE